MVGHDKTGVEADSELTDDAVRGTLKVLIGILNRILELLRARFGDCSKVIDDLVTCHAHSRVKDSDGTLL